MLLPREMQMPAPQQVLTDHPDIVAPLSAGPCCLLGRAWLCLPTGMCGLLRYSGPLPV